jgi:hypothetical protein
MERLQLALAINKLYQATNNDERQMVEQQLSVLGT